MGSVFHFGAIWFLARSLFRMSGHTPSLMRLEQRAAEADQIIEYLKQQVQLLKEKAMVQATVREEKKLMVENGKLKKEIEELKRQLLEKERRRGGGVADFNYKPRPLRVTVVRPPESLNHQQVLEIERCRQHQRKLTPKGGPIRVIAASLKSRAVCSLKGP
ncbi:aminoacyl tRNA synthase complex-interacting multifunctional protein 1a [Tachysurus ichikawai]